LVLVFAALALTAVLLTGYGSGDDHPTVEGGLQHYLSSIDPQACLGGGFADRAPSQSEQAPRG
jgi:hypothetical protein